MKLLGKLIVLAFLFSLGNRVLAQSVVVHFADDSVTYYNQLEAFMKDARSDEGKIFMKEFEPYWYGGKFSENYRQGVYAVCNLMLKAKKKAYPDFRDYLYTVLSFIDSKYQTEESFGVWQETVTRMLSSRKRSVFGDYLSFSRNLFEQNAIYVSGAVTWGVDNSNYDFGFDSLPKITFKKLNLICYAKGDSSTIYETSGTFYPTTDLWIGRSGHVKWLRAGFDEKVVRAEILGQYKIDIRKTNYEIDTVEFTNTNYFAEQTLNGKLIEKVIAPTSSGKISYPRFESFDKRITIKNIEPNVNYTGGFAMYGERFVGKGSKEEPSIISFYRNDTLFSRAISETFLIYDNKIVSENAAIRFYLQEDSIYHPGLQFKFFREQKEIALIRDRKGQSRSSYYNSFHQIDMDVELLSWKMGEEELYFKNLLGGTNKYALFESSNFFNENRYYDVQGYSDQSPLVIIHNLAKKRDTNLLSVYDLATFMGMSTNQVNLLLSDLSARGLIDLDYANEEFKVLDRLYTYVFGKTGFRDYDVIQFHSDPKDENNGILNLLNYDLQLEGVGRIILSDSQQVVIYPTNREITVKKNRDFIFAGMIQAGRLDFFGREFSFEYDNFKLNLTNVDSLRMMALSNEVDEYGRNSLKPVRSVIEAINGELLIDAPDNKSGFKLTPDYPIFKSLKDSYVYYDKKSIHQGVYKRDSFYFHLEPFTIDSLDNFSNEGLSFAGEFFSGGIFPDFEEVLRLQPDFSLGFERKTPEEGFPAYGGKGIYSNNINLSNRGLRGEGKLEYLTSTTFSPDFMFFPDSMRTIADEYYVAQQKEGVEYPNVTAEDLLIQWKPMGDVLYATKIEKPLVFYDSISEFHGKTTLRPSGLTGNGLFKFEKAELESHKISFLSRTFDSDTADFRLLEGDASDRLSFSTTNVNAHVDFDERFGEFKSNGGGSYINFPINQYICFMEEFKWFMDTEDIELAAGAHGEEQAATDTSDVRLEGAEFISTHPDQDSLSFFSTLARYDLRSKIINAKGVQYILTADARVYPDSQQVIVERKAKMQTLENSGIVANTVTQYHNIYNARVNIFGKKTYAGSGTIDYKDENEMTQQIQLDNIDVDTTGQTIATGVIGSDVGFTLSRHFEYRGKVILEASKAFLTFKGVTRMSHECATLDRAWVKFKSEIDPKNIYIPVDTNLEDMGDTKLYASIMLGGDSSGVYTAFLNKRNNYSDAFVLPAYGYLTFDRGSDEYRVSTREKLQENSLTGNYLSLATKSCKIYGEGKIDLGTNTGQIVVDGAGNMIHNQTENEVIVDMMMLINFHFEDNALKEMAEVINKNIVLDPVKLDRETYEDGLRELLGKEDADKLISDLGLYGSFKKFPNELNKSLFLNEVKFKFNEETNSYLSFGKIGLGNILKEQVNKYVTGKVELIKKRSGDVLNIYLESDANTWFFFNYSRGILWTISSNEVFNTLISETKPEKAKLEVKRKEEPYKFMITTERKRRDFLRRFEE
ncbi:MAG: hypothetical protein RH916_07660 [Vicingaceae bacterium]